MENYGQIEDNFRGSNKLLARNLVNIVNELEDEERYTRKQISKQEK